MINNRKLHALTLAIIILSGAVSTLIFHKSKLYFSGDGGGMDELIVYKCILLALGAYLLLLIAVNFLGKSMHKNMRLLVPTIILGLLVTLIVGTIFTRLGYHSACEESGSSAVACQDEKSQWSPFY